MVFANASDTTKKLFFPSSRTKYQFCTFAIINGTLMLMQMQQL